MISPHTPPGTKIAAIEDGTLMHGRPEANIRKGEIYTVATIEPDNRVKAGFICTLVEREPISKYCIGLFRLAVLPRSLTSLLETKSITAPRKTIREPQHEPEAGG